MSLLVRKINRTKWKKIDADYAADAITNCLRTSQNTFSVWEVDTDQDEDIDNVVLALISDHLDTVDVVILDSNYFLKNDINIVENRGLVKVKDLEYKHRDLTEINFTKLGLIAFHVFEKIEEDKWKRYTVGMLKKILYAAILNGRLRKEDLSESIRKKIEEFSNV